MAAQRTRMVGDIVDENPMSRFQIGIIVMCGCVAVLDGFDTQCIGFLAPAISESLGHPLSGFAPVFVAGLLGLMAGAAVLGPLADRIGRKWVLTGSTFAFGIMSFLSAYVTSFDMLVVLRFLTGIGLGGALTNVVAITAEYAPKRMQAIFVSLLFTGMPLGAGIGGLVAAALLPVWGWQAVFVAGGVLPVALALVLALRMPESARFLVTRRTGQSDVRALLARIVPDPATLDGIRFVPGTPAPKGMSVRHLFTEGRASGTLLLWTSYFMNLIIIYFIVSWLPAVIRQAGMPLSTGIMAISLFSAGGVIGSLLQGVTMQAVGARRCLAVQFTLSMLLIGSLGMLPPSAVLLQAVALLLGVVVQGAQAGLNALVAGFYPTAIRSTGVGWALAVGRIGSIVGPVLGGVVLSLGWSLQQIFLAGAVPALCAGLAVLVGGLMRNAELQGRPDEMRFEGDPSHY
ncbi:MFS transporter [Roseomonas sp. NAR14]|uniref:MFS transporter n=1 Tax=Roseomonas acroporae TaxID=2937791 RepID=A0A9X2BYW2_9PROT|nr:MFS transporter [Roseomonas acroporae]MCK8787394.1 MFS transporter [Roseomonas acroporae]